MTNLNPRDPENPNRELLQENLAMREQNIAAQEQNRAIRENDSAATGLMLGILLLGVVAVGFGAYYLTQRTTTPAPTKTIIERERTKLVPTQPSTAPNINVTVPNPAPPNVNVTIPDSAPRTAPAPVQAPASAPSSSNTSPSTSNTAPSNTAPSTSDTAPSTAPANP